MDKHSHFHQCSRGDLTAEESELRDVQPQPCMSLILITASSRSWVGAQQMGNGDKVMGLRTEPIFYYLVTSIKCINATEVGYEVTSPDSKGM